MPYSNFFTEVKRLNGKAVKGEAYKVTFNQEFEKIDSKIKSKVLKGLSELNACEEFEDYWSEQDRIRYNRVPFVIEVLEEPEVSATLRQQVLAMQFIFENLKVENIDATAKARFIQFFTGKGANSSNIRNTNIYDYVTNPLSVSPDRRKKDLEFVRKFFEDLGLSGIVEEINKAIDKKIKI